MMNGVPKKHSFSSSGERRGKQTRGWGCGGAAEGKDKMGGWGRVDMPGEYIIALQSSTVPRDKLERDTRQRVNLDSSVPPPAAPRYQN